MLHAVVHVHLESWSAEASKVRGVSSKEGTLYKDSPKRFVQAVCGRSSAFVSKLLLELFSSLLQERKRHLPAIALVSHHKEGCAEEGNFSLHIITHTATQATSAARRCLLKPPSTR